MFQHIILRLGSRLSEPMQRIRNLGIWGKHAKTSRNLWILWKHVETCSDVFVQLGNLPSKPIDLGQRIQEFHIQALYNMFQGLGSPQSKPVELCQNLGM